MREGNARRLVWKEERIRIKVRLLSCMPGLVGMWLQILLKFHWLVQQVRGWVRLSLSLVQIRLVVISWGLALAFLLTTDDFLNDSLLRA